MRVLLNPRFKYHFFLRHRHITHLHRQVGQYPCQITRMEHGYAEAQIIRYRPCHLQQILLQGYPAKVFGIIHVLVTDSVFITIFHYLCFKNESYFKKFANIQKKSHICKFCEIFFRNCLLSANFLPGLLRTQPNTRTPSHTRYETCMHPLRSTASAAYSYQVLYQATSRMLPCASIVR